MTASKSNLRCGSIEIDLSKVPDDVLLAESARRLRARQTMPPRAKVLRQCPHCSHAFGARELRAHVPGCRKRKPQTPLRAGWTGRKVKSADEQDEQAHLYWKSRTPGERIVATWELTEAAYSIKRAG